MVTQVTRTPYTLKITSLAKISSTKWCHPAIASQHDLGDFLGDVLDNLVHVELLHWCEGAWHVLCIKWRPNEIMWMSSLWYYMQRWAIPTVFTTS
jgi:hypothetical protein